MYVSVCNKVTFAFRRTLARSVVVLIPLFGVYFIVFQLPVEKMGDTVDFVFLCIEMFFNSYQVNNVIQIYVIF